jgi:Ca2+-binding RTX toxin-like protein
MLHAPRLVFGNERSLGRIGAAPRVTRTDTQPTYFAAAAFLRPAPTSGNLSVTGGAHTITVGSGNNTIFGGGGTDVLTGGSG